MWQTATFDSSWNCYIFKHILHKKVKISFLWFEIGSNSIKRDLISNLCLKFQALSIVNRSRITGVSVTVLMVGETNSMVGYHLMPENRSTQLGVWGHCEPPSRCRAAPWLELEFFQKVFEYRPWCLKS